MTEEEAKTKWCPFVRFTRDDLTPNRSESLADVTRCIGSACMAWRWEFSPAAATERNRTRSAEDQLEASGTCGLAGRP